MFEFLRRRRSTVEAEVSLTPLEAAQDSALWRAIFKTDIPPAETVKRYKRIGLAPSANLYTAETGASALIVGFSGKKHRLMMPAAIMLQNTDDQRYDMLILSDPRKLHYDRGIEGFGDSLSAMARRIRSLANERGYRSLITYGTSMGGFPALRMGALLRADRAISCGGSPPFHPTRLLDDQGTISAFDVICDCHKPAETPFFVLYGDGFAEDVHAAVMISTITPRVRRVPIRCDGHNFAIRIHLKGRLSDYCRQIFDLDNEPDAGRLAMMAK